MCYLIPVIISVIITGNNFVTAVSDTSYQDLQNIARSNDDFGYQLLHRLEVEEHSKRSENGGEPKNLFISPFSISTVLTMAMAGASGDTFEEIKNTLGYNNMTDSQVYTAFDTLLHELNNFNSATNNTLQLANAIALQNEYPLLSSYLDIVKNRLKAEIFSVNFKKEADEATKKINLWAEKQTKGKIAKIFDGKLSNNTRLVLLNALYFKGKWKNPFDNTSTDEMAFNYGENKKVNVSMMHKTFSTINYASFDEGQLVELPYHGDSLSMLLFLPKSTADVDSISLAFSHFFKAPNGYTKLHGRKVILTMPRFKIESSFKLKPALQLMGIKEAFGRANFSRMVKDDDDDDLSVSQVLHKAVVEVNEKGAEAAAVTATDYVSCSFPLAPVSPIQISFNRPFLFAIRDIRLQLTLFSGIVNKP